MPHTLKHPDESCRLVMFYKSKGTRSIMIHGIISTYKVGLMIAQNTAFCALAGISQYLVEFGGIWRYLAVLGGIWRYLAVFGRI